MKPVSLYFLLLFCYNLLAQDTITIYYDKDWKELKNKSNATYYRKAYQNENKIWVAKDYYMSKKIQMIGSYNSNKMKTREGHFVYYYENGNKETEGNFIKDRREGLWTSWFETGEKKSELNYKNGDLDGFGIYWHENGEKKSEGLHTKNYKTDVWRHYYESKKLKGIERYSNNLILLETFYPNGKIESKGNIINERFEDEWSYWNAEGRLILKGNFLNGLKNGEWLRYFANGEILKLQFKNGVFLGEKLGSIFRNL